MSERTFDRDVHTLQRYACVFYTFVDDEVAAFKQWMVDEGFTSKDARGETVYPKDFSVKKHEWLEKRIDVAVKKNDWVNVPKYGHEYVKRTVEYIRGWREQLLRIREMQKIGPVT